MQTDEITFNIKILSEKMSRKKLNKAGELKRKMKTPKELGNSRSKHIYKKQTGQLWARDESQKRITTSVLLL